MRVWDPVVRGVHWGVAACVATAWLSTLDGVGFGPHENAGLIAGALVAGRLLWGARGRTHASLRQFVRGPRVTWTYATQVWRGTERRHLGHNPLGGWMALALWTCVLALAVTGWLYTTDAYWGEAWLDQLHRRLGWLLLGLIAAHLAGVAFTSWRHGENLVRAMIDGHKPAPNADDVV